jgi:hypothetical protein
MTWSKDKLWFEVAQLNCSNSWVKNFQSVVKLQLVQFCHIISIAKWTLTLQNFNLEWQKHLAHYLTKLLNYPFPAL